MPRKNDKADKVILQNSLKTLAANIRFSSVDHLAHSIAVVSSIPSEGKTTIAVGLGKAFAAGGSTVIMVECDLRRRSLASALGAHGRHGLYSVVSGRHTVEEAAINAGMPNLYFLDAEPSIPNPADLLQSRRFHNLMGTLTKMYDYVIVDTPPVNTFVDAAVVASLTDATVLVVRQNFTRREDVRASYTQLKQAGAHVIGTILNFTDADTSNKYYDYYEEGSSNRGNNKSYEILKEDTPHTSKAPVATPDNVQATPDDSDNSQDVTAVAYRRPATHLASEKPVKVALDETTELLKNAGYYTDDASTVNH